MVALVFSALAAVGGTAGSADAWQIDASHSSASFSVSHMVVGTARGRIGGIAGTVTFSPKNITKAKVDVTLDAKTVNTDDEKRDAHLRSADFFDVEKHPKIRFVSKAVKKAKGGKWDIVGDLTMRGVTKEVVLTGTVSDVVKSPWGKLVVAVSAATKINRHDFGVSWSKKLDAGGLVVGDEVTISLEIELNRAASSGS